MAEHNFNVMGEDLCQFFDNSGAQNEADDDNNKNYRLLVPTILHTNRLYRKPPDWVFAFVKNEKGDRKSLRENLRGKRKSILDNIENIARGSV